MTEGQSWLESRGIDDVEESSATREDPNHTLLQHTSKRSDEWLSFEGEAMTIER